MTPQGHPVGSARAVHGFCVVWYDDATQQTVALGEFERVRHASEAAKRATRMMMSDDQLADTPLSIVVDGLHGDRHAIDLLRVQQVSEWPPSAVARETADRALYEESDDEREPWQS